jgi:hypothetical protein
MPYQRPHCTLRLVRDRKGLAMKAKRMFVAVTVVAMSFGLPAVAGASTAPNVCPRGFGDPQTLQDLLVRYGGSYTTEEIIAGFESRDLNGNGLVCAKPVSSHDKYFPLQMFFAVDDLSEPIAPPPPE